MRLRRDAPAGSPPLKPRDGQLARAPPVRRQEGTLDRHGEPKDGLGPVEPPRLPAEREHAEQQRAGDHECEVEAAVRDDGKRALEAACRQRFAKARPTLRTRRTHAAARLRDPRRAAAARSGRAASSTAPTGSGLSGRGSGSAPARHGSSSVEVGVAARASARSRASSGDSGAATQPRQRRRSDGSASIASATANASAATCSHAIVAVARAAAAELVRARHERLAPVDGHQVLEMHRLLAALDRLLERAVAARERAPSPPRCAAAPAPP